MSKRLGVFEFRVGRVLVVLVVWCLLVGGLGVPVGAQSGEGLGVVGVPPAGGGGLVAGQVDGVVGSGGDGLMGVDVEAGSPPLDGPLGEGLDRLDVSGGHGPVSGQEGVAAPVADVFGGGFLEAPVAVEAVEGPAPEGFGGLAMCAGGTVCGSAQILPGPTGLSCSVTASVIVFSWNAVSGADDYTAKLQLAVAGSPQTVRTTSSRTVVYAGLSSSTTYYIGVHSNVGGVAQYYSGVYCTTAVGSPWCGVVSGSGVQLVWRADSRVHQWFVGRATTGSQYTDGRLLAASTLSTVFTGLGANVSYTFFFWWRASPTSAWNQVHPSRVCTTTAPPAAPVVTCTTTASTIAVSWGSVDGALRYRVSRGSGWATPVGLSHVFGNLAESTAYSVRVQGWNSAGWGQTGTAACTTKAAVLPAPTGLECEATSSQIKFSWEPVAGADSYAAKIQLAQPGSAQTQISTALTSAAFTGLAASTRYWVSVLAVKNSSPQNFAGVYCTTLADIDAPALSCTADSTSVTVSWDAVTEATKYRARVGGGDWTADITAATHTFTGLAPGTMHSVAVQSGGAAGWGNAAKVRCVTAAAGVYCDDTTSNSIVLEWDPVDGAEYWYAAISAGTGYIGNRTHNRRIDTGTSTEFTGLENGTRYVMLLWWYDGDKWHPTTPPPECWTKPLDTPKITGHTTGGNTLTVEWDPVEGAELYQARISPAGSSGAFGASEGGGWETVLYAGTTHTFTDLEPGTQYTVELRAGTLAKVSEASVHGTAYQPESGRTSAAPTMSTVECKANTATTIDIEWKDPNGEHQWRVARTVVDQSGNIQHLSPQTFAKGTTKAKLTSLEPNRFHWISVWNRADSQQSWQPIEPAPHCYTSPSDLVVHQCPQTADTDGTVRWMPNGATYYRITRDRNQAKPQWTTTNTTAHTFTGLAEDTTYKIGVQAWTPKGWTTSTNCDMTTLPPIPNGIITGTGTYSFTEGTIKGVLYAAGEAISKRSGSTSTGQAICGNPSTTVTKERLAAMMLSIPVRELSFTNPSPMTLSRWDNLHHQKQIHGGEEKSLNERLFTYMEPRTQLYSDDSENRGAHWSTGTGLWQLDKFTDKTKSMNHAERADIRVGGLEVATFLLNKHCSEVVDDAGIKKAYKSWNDCNDEAPNECYESYIGISDSIYKSNLLNIKIVSSQKEVDGGIQERTCRWASNVILMPCYLYDLEDGEGDTSDYQVVHTKKNEQTQKFEINWVTSTTPLPMAFLSFTDSVNKNKFAVWPKQWPASTNWQTWPSESVSADHTIFRAVHKGEEVRCSPGRDPSPESTDARDAAMDCAEETYKPFGSRISNHNFLNGNMVVEGWFDDSVPYQEGGSEQDRHRLQVENCQRYWVFGVSVVLCKWISL